MGNDYLASKKDRETKAWRRGVAQTEGDWLAGESRVKRVFRAKGAGPCGLTVDQPVVLRLVSDNQVVVSAGVHAVATLSKPSLALVEHLKRSHGVGLATVQRATGMCSRWSCFQTFFAP